MLAMLEMMAIAQVNPRSTFPGRRVGGGTRGECNSRTIAHLVPEASIFAPAADRTVGLVEGPIGSPRPMQLEFRPLSGSSKGKTYTRDLPAAPAGITLITLASIPQAMVWASSYRCGDTNSVGGSDPLAFIDGGAPPALSLLVQDVTPADRSVQLGLARLRKVCGRSISRQEVGQTFGLSDVITADWPAVLPVRCL